MSVISQNIQDVKVAKADAMQNMVSHVLPYHNFMVSGADTDSKKMPSKDYYSY